VAGVRQQGEGVGAEFHQHLDQHKACVQADPDREREAKVLGCMAVAMVVMSMMMTVVMVIMVVVAAMIVICVMGHQLIFPGAWAERASALRATALRAFDQSWPSCAISASSASAGM